MMNSYFDLHVHTTKSSSDSSLTPEALVNEAIRIGLNGVCLTEHGGWENKEEFSRFAKRQNFLLIHGLEITTEFGHIITIGLDGYVKGYYRIRELRQAINQCGGYMIAAHPFRNVFNKPPYNNNPIVQQPQPSSKDIMNILSHPIFQALDDIEVINGANSEKENIFAREVATVLGTPGSGGSDAHSTHGLGKAVTVFKQEIHCQSELLEALHSKAYSPYKLH
ncbi:PHP domain-containing protein [SAR202 cluster bacterium AD-802-E10_MRT_200m]|nr:PHP domain-containing protein [SAR202 cluster bacterium AD-802-E10_MRT_200m]MQF82784.1 PHP domain-containing protein [SAR202 cluster bacterium AD-802-E10_MRT_200m]